MKLTRPEPQRKTTPGRHLLYAVIGWGAFLYTVAVLPPPLDSHIKPSPLGFWSILTATAFLTLYVAFAAAAYLYQSWSKLPTAPNKTWYGIWIGLESVLLVSLESMALYLLFHMVWGIRSLK